MKCQAKWCRSIATITITEQVPNWQHTGWVAVAVYLCAKCYGQRYRAK